MPRPLAADLQHSIFPRRPSLSAGQSYQLVQANGGTNGKLLKLSIEEILTLQVNRSTGAVSISNVGTTSKSLDGYSILSSHGSLIAASWNSLQDQSVAGWVEEGAPTTTDLSELNPTSSSTINASNSLALGTPYAAQFPAFGVDPDDISFEYAPDGRTIQGSVVYSGTKVNNNLIVSVNPSTGQASSRTTRPSPFRSTATRYTRNPVRCSPSTENGSACRTEA